MPPKKRAAEITEEIEVDKKSTEHDFITSPISTASSVTTASSISSRSSGTLSAEQLEQILAANHRSMATLLATLAPSVPAGPSSRSHVKIPKWTDEETPYEYFNKFEKALKHNGVDKAAWGQLLPVYLAGKAQAAFAQVDSASLDDYEAVKAVLLESLGDTPASADRKWWSLYRQAGEDAGSFYLRVRATGIRRLHAREEILEKIVLSRFVSLLPSDSYTSVMSRQPKDGLEAARIVQEFEETRSFSRKRQPWRQDHNHHNAQAFRREQNSGGNSGSNSGGNGSSGGGTSPKEHTGSQNPSTGASASGGTKSVKSDRQNRKPIVCHGCGEPGHIRPNCPNRVRRVKSPEHSKVMVVSGWLAGCKTDKLRVDTGADRTVVREDFVPKAAYTGEVVRLDSWRGAECTDHELASIAIKVGDVEVVSTVAVVEQLDCPALLGSDLGKEMTKELMKTVVAQLDDESKEVQGGEPVRTTRAQARKEAAKVKEDDMASAQAECVCQKSLTFRIPTLSRIQSLLLLKS